MSYKDIEDIRQSEKWAEYLDFVGWHSERTKGGVNIELRNFLLWKLTKIQRPKQLNKKDILEIEEICKKNRTFFIKIEPTLKQNLELMEEMGFFESYAPLTPPSTIYMDLTKSEEDLWKNVSKSGKYSINRGKREGANVEIFSNPSDRVLKQFFTAEKEASKTRKFYIQKMPHLLKKRDIFKDNCFVAVTKNNSGKLLCSNFYLGFKGNVWFMHGGTTDIGRKTKAGYTMFWEVMLHYKKKGFNYLDLDGRDDDRFPKATEQWAGFSYFKEKFGGINVQFPVPMVKKTSMFLKVTSRLTGNMPI